MNRTIPTALALLALFGVGATAFAQPSASVAGVRDRAGMFSPEVVKGADDTLREVRRQTHWSAVIETVDSLDGKPIKDAALENARALKVHGLYLLLARNDHKFYAEPSHTAQKAFSHEKIKEIDDAILAAFKAKKFDQGLRDAVALIRRDAEAAPDTTTASAPVASARPAPPAEPARPAEPAAPAPPAREPQQGSVLPMLLIGGGVLLLVLWLLSRAFRGATPAAPQSFNQAGVGYAPDPSSGPAPQPGYRPGPQAGYGPAPQPGYRPAPQPGYGPPPQAGYGPPPQPGYGYPPPPAQQGGGGFLSGVLGGAAGAVAGNILYDKFGRPHEAPGVPPHAPAGAVPPPQDTNWPHGGGAGGSGAGIDAPASPPGETYDPNAGGGGDWGTPDQAPEPNADASAGGDWGAAPDPNVDASAGGDWGTPDAAPEPDAGGGGDWGAPEPEPQPDSGGGDWGSSDPAPDDNQGGSW